jgi:hypothetical protein
LDAQPLNKIGYTPKLKTMRSEIMLKGQLLKKLFNGVTAHRVSEIISINTGDKENIFQFTLELTSNCLTKSFTASLKG